MYMFFWFFKQLYYCLRRIFKSGILLLIVFFIAFLFIFIKPSFAYNDDNLPSAIMDKYNSLGTALDNNNIILKLKSNQNAYVILYNVLKNNTEYDRLNRTSFWSYRNYNNVIGFTSPSWTTFYSTETYNNGSTWSNPYLWTSNNAMATYNLQYYDIVYSKYPIRAYNITGYEDGSYIFQPSTTDPYIVNSSNDITTWNFDFLTINCGDINPNSTFYLHCDYEGYTFSYDDLQQYITVSNNTAIINIPKSLLNQSIVLRNGFNFSFSLQANKPNMQVLYYELGSYTMNLTNEEQQQINEDSDKQVLSDISNNQKETTQAVENLENTITNSNIEDSSINLPTDNTNDITQAGLNGIFTSIYNAFCVGQAQDIVFPIPFTNKNITLQPNYIRNMLTSVGANWVISIIEAFWWFLISRFIIKDITNKITKIKSGNIENIENTNIKGDML